MSINTQFNFLTPNEETLFEFFEELTFFLEYSLENLHSSSHELLKKVDTILDGNEFNIDSQNSKGNTLLHLAFKHKQIPYIALLLTKGANPFIKNDKEQLALNQFDWKNPEFTKQFEQFLHFFVLGRPYQDIRADVKKQFEWVYIENYNDCNYLEQSSHQSKSISLGIDPSLPTISLNAFKNRIKNFHPDFKQSLFESITSNNSQVRNSFMFASSIRALQFLKDNQLHNHFNFISICNLNSFPIPEKISNYIYIGEALNKEDNSLFLYHILNHATWDKQALSVFKEFISNTDFSMNDNIVLALNESYFSKQFSPYVDNQYYQVIKNVIEMCVINEMQDINILDKKINTIFEDENTIAKILNQSRYQDLYYSIKMNYTLEDRVPHKTEQHKKKKI